MRVFAADAAEYRDQYARQGWIHIRGGLDPDFLSSVQDHMRTTLTGDRLGAFAIKGKKGQAIYDFSGEVDFPGEIFDFVATLCGLDRERITLSERHIQAYDEHADPEPPAHKDRFPSQVSVGLSIDIPAASRLVLYPDGQRAVNPFNSAADHYHSLQPEERPEVVLAGEEAVEIDDEPGDVVAFPGSTTWHLRRNSAGAVNIYLKLNDFDCDPLGVDPETPVRRQRTRALLDAGDHGALERSRAVLSRRLDFVGRHYSRNGWQETLQARLWGSEAFGITPEQFELIKAIDGGRPLSSLVDDVTAGRRRSREAVERDLMVLAERGAIDLLS